MPPLLRSSLWPYLKNSFRPAPAPQSNPAADFHVHPGSTRGALQHPLRRNNTFPVFATYLIPAASPPPLRGGAKSASNPFAGARKPHTCGFSLFIWPCLGPRRSRRCQLILGVPLRAAPKAPMLPAAPPCALPPPSYLFSGAHRSPVSILFLSGLLAGCSPGVHPCGN